MPYIPDLIPKEHKVLPDYFKSSSGSRKIKKDSSAYLLIAIILFLFAAFNLHRFFFALTLAFTGFLFTHFGKRWLEKQGRFTLTSTIRLIAGGILLLLCVPLFSYYQGAEAQALHEQEIRHQQALLFTRDSLQKDSIRRDSLKVYLTKSLKMKPEAGLQTLFTAKHLIVTSSDEEQLKRNTQLLQLKLAENEIEKGQYQQALPLLDTLDTQKPKDPNILYERALCHMHTGHMGLAVGDLAIALEKGSLKAKKLYNTVNPLRRRITGYITLCSDGSTSYATGRGACSWHGGVAEWNHPMYETYRKYSTE